MKHRASSPQQDEAENILSLGSHSHQINFWYFRISELCLLQAVRLCGNSDRTIFNIFNSSRY